MGKPQVLADISNNVLPKYKKFREVFYTRKVRPRDLTENFGTGSAYFINNQVNNVQM